MSMRLGHKHPARATRGLPPGDTLHGFPWDDLLGAAPAWQLVTADCCPAPAAYRVVLPRRPGGAPRELYLCGHHRRATVAAQERCGAAVFDSRGQLV